VDVDNKLGERVVLTLLDSATVRACLEGPFFARCQACGKLSDAELAQVFGARRLEYARRMARAGVRLRHPLVAGALADAGLRPILAAARFLQPTDQLRAASIATATPYVRARSRRIRDADRNTERNAERDVEPSE
jgi:hypothetical protein